MKGKLKALEVRSYREEKKKRSPGKKRSLPKSYRVERRKGDQGKPHQGT